MDGHFAAQEPPRPEGRGLRTHLPTARRETFNAEQAKLAASRQRRQQRREERLQASATNNSALPLISPAPSSQIHPSQPLHVGQPTIVNTALPLTSALPQSSQEYSMQGVSYVFPDGLNQQAPSTTLPQGQQHLLDIEDFVLTTEPDWHSGGMVDENNIESDHSSQLSSPSPDITSTPVMLAQHGAPTNQNASRQSPLLPRPINAISLFNQATTPARTPSRLVRRTHMISPINKENESPTPVNQALVEPTMLRKRTHDEISIASDEDDASFDDSAPTPGTRNSGLRAADLSPARKRILNRALIYFRQYIYTENAYPQDDKVESQAIAAWYEAQHDLATQAGFVGNARPTEDELALIKMRVSQLRGQVITSARKAAPSFFGLNSPQLTTEAVRTRVGELLRKDAFAYQDWSNCQIPGTMYRTPLVSTILNETAFQNADRSEGLQGNAFATEVPLPAIALILTAIQCSIEEYKAGQRCKKPMFTATLYQPVYRRHLETLNKWLVFTSAPGRSGGAKRLQAELLECAKTHAGVNLNPASGNTVETLNEADFLANEL